MTAVKVSLITVQMWPSYYSFLFQSIQVFHQMTAKGDDIRSHSRTLKDKNRESDQFMRSIVLDPDWDKNNHTALYVRHRPVWFCLLQTLYSCKSCTSRRMSVWSHSRLLEIQSRELILPSTPQVSRIAWLKRTLAHCEHLQTLKRKKHGLNKVKASGRGEYFSRLKLPSKDFHMQRLCRSWIIHECKIGPLH